MTCRVSKACKFNVIDFLSEYVHVVEGDDTGVFHCAPVEFWHVDLVVLVEWEVVAEDSFVDFHAFVCDFENEISDAS